MPSTSFIIQATLRMSPWVWLAATGALFLAATIVLAATQAPLGSTIFFVCAGTAAAAYVALLSRLWNERTTPRRFLATALLLALAIRAPLAVPRVNSDNDMVRYLWDGRVQTLGYSPYVVLPSDPAMAGMHTDETRRMPSLGSPTPYPPGAQLFFWLIVSIRDSTRAMKLALVACDLLTILVRGSGAGPATTRCPSPSGAKSWSTTSVVNATERAPTPDRRRGSSTRSRRRAVRRRRTPTTSAPGTAPRASSSRRSTPSAGSTCSSTTPASSATGWSSR